MRQEDVVDAVVEDHRRMLILADENDRSPDGRNAMLIARVLFQRNHDRLALLAEAVGRDGPAAERLVDKIQGTNLHEADRLAFYDLVMDLPATPRVLAAQRSLERTQQTYEDKLRALLDRLAPGARGPREPLPEPWDDYLAFLRQRYDRARLLDELAAYGDPAGQGARGATWLDSDRQIVGHQLPVKTVVLTFDDGPAPRFTEAVLEILDRHQIKAVFFEVGQNVRRMPEQSARIARAGHAVGNHSLTHAFLPRLGRADLLVEIGATSQAIEAATSAPPVLFRAPYGAQTEQVVRVARDLGMKMVLWSVDSLDWKDPLPESIVERVARQLDHDRRGIILFHDIHRRTLQALPMLIDRLLAEGYAFLGWNGRDFSRPVPLPSRVAGRGP
jgi:peptidoglycan/xylan/chitin deacetylase (PgdA/CDA1 family)